MHDNSPFMNDFHIKLQNVYRLSHELLKIQGCISTFLPTACYGTDNSVKKEDYLHIGLSTVYVFEQWEKMMFNVFHNLVVVW